MSLTSITGDFPYRMALAGGWIDQPFVSRLNPDPFGSMVVVGLEPSTPFMDRCGMATGTRKVALRLWGRSIPDRDPDALVRELYAEENRDRRDPSGSQDMIGLILPGVNRLDYDIRHEGGVFPRHIESARDPAVAAWLERVIHMVPILPRPEGYSPLDEKRLDPEWVRRLGRSGRECFDAIVACDVAALGDAMNECMRCWEALLPCTVRHPTIPLDLPAILKAHQDRHPGAMYSGCGGGYLYVVSETPVPGSFPIRVRR